MTFKKLLEEYFNPTVRGVHSKRKRQRKKALKLKGGHPQGALYAAMMDSVVYGTGIMRTDGDRAIWQSTVTFELPLEK